MKLSPEQIADLEYIKKKWDAAIAKYDGSRAAGADGFSQIALARKLGVSSQRINAMFAGRAPVSADLREVLTPMLKLRKLPKPPAKPKPPESGLNTYEANKDSIQAAQARIQKRIDAGEIVKTTAAILEDPDTIKKWFSLVESYGGKSAAIRGMINDAA